MKDAGPPGASSNGFNENLALFNAGKCGMWIDATVAAVLRHRPEGVARSPTRSASRWRPTTGLGKSANWLWAWSLAIPAGSQEGRRRREVHRLGDQQGLHRARRCQGRLGQRAAGHAQLALQQPGVPEGGALRQADARTRSTRPTRRSRRSSRCPMSACSSSAIPEFQGLGTTVGQLFSAALAGQTTVDAALAQRAECGHRARDEAGRLHQVTSCRPVSCRLAATRAAACPPLASRRSPSRCGDAAMATRQTADYSRRLLVAPAVGRCC